MTAISTSSVEPLQNSVDIETVVELDVPSEEETTTRWSRADVIGITLSVLCAIHCAATPVLLAALPSMGLAWFESPWVHQVLFGGCFLLAGNAVLRGYRVHRKSVVPSVAAGGLALLALSAFVFPPPCCAAGDETTTGSATAATTCANGCCSHGAVQTGTASDATGSGGSMTVSTTATSGGAVASSSSMSFATLSDWWLRLMTPLGGLLLIVAHGMNIRWIRSCQCGCCPA